MGETLFVAHLKSRRNKRMILTHCQLVKKSFNFGENVLSLDKPVVYDTFLKKINFAVKDENFEFGLS